MLCGLGRLVGGVREPGRRGDAVRAGRGVRGRGPPLPPPLHAKEAAHAHPLQAPAARRRGQALWASIFFALEAV